MTSARRLRDLPPPEPLWRRAMLNRERKREARSSARERRRIVADVPEHIHRQVRMRDACAIRIAC